MVGSGEVFGGGVEGVEVAGGGLAEPDRGIALVAVCGGGGAGGVVAGQDLFEQVDRGARLDGVGMNDAVRVPVADDLQIEMVGGRPRVSMVYSCCRDSAPVARPCMVSAVTPWAPCTVVAYPSSTEVGRSRRAAGRFAGSGCGERSDCGRGGRG